MCPNGGRWIALGYRNGCFFRPNDGQEGWKEYVPFDGPVHKTNKEFAQGFFHYWSGLDSNVFFDIPDGVFALCSEIIKNNKSVDSLSDEEKYLFSIALEKNLFIKDGESFRPNYYFVERKVWEQLEKLSLDFYPAGEKYFNKAYNLILNEFGRTIPKHLHWQMGNFLSVYLGHFVTCSLYEGTRQGTVLCPDSQSPSARKNNSWLSLFASEL